MGKIPIHPWVKSNLFDLFPSFVHRKFPWFHLKKIWNSSSFSGTPAPVWPFRSSTARCLGSEADERWFFTMKMEVELWQIRGFTMFYIKTKNLRPGDSGLTDPKKNMFPTDLTNNCGNIMAYITRCNIFHGYITNQIWYLGVSDNENVHELAVSMGNIVINHQIWRYLTQFSDRPISLIIVYGETGI